MPKKTAPNTSLESTVAQVLVRQYHSAFDMLANAVNACPPHLWRARVWPSKDDAVDFPSFWYIAVHALFWTDVYMHGSFKGFAPPAPFGTEEFQAEFVMPARAYTPAEIHGYITHCRARTMTRLGGMDEAALLAQTPFRWLLCSHLEMYVYNLRHMQEHTAQLSVFLGQTAGVESPWVQLSKT